MLVIRLVFLAVELDKSVAALEKKCTKDKEN